MHWGITTHICSSSADIEDAPFFAMWIYRHKDCEGVVYTIGTIKHTVTVEWDAIFLYPHRTKTSVKNIVIGWFVRS